MKEIDRRTFLKFGAAVGVGTVVNAVLIPAEIGANLAVKQVGGRPTGISTNESDFISLVRAPILEEVNFRAVPSFGLSLWERRTSVDLKSYLKDSLNDVLTGNKNSFKLTRRELLVGTVTSLLFGALHNITSKGFDTQAIPASQIVGGFGLWWLQRKFGILSNITAHSVSNFITNLLYRK